MIDTILEKLTLDSVVLENLLTGLKITGLGMGIVFAILIVIYISIKILARFAK